MTQPRLSPRGLSPASQGDRDPAGAFSPAPAGTSHRRRANQRERLFTFLALLCALSLFLLALAV